MMQIKNKLLHRNLLAIVLGAITADGVTDTLANYQLEEVLVTAQKRAEGLQDVPISIAAVSGDSIRSNGVIKLEGLAATVPSLHVAEAVAGDQIFMRGIGSGNNMGFEQAVGQVIDGFFYGRSRFGRSSFLDIERVEVLKGPQGALVGKNTSGGAINITTSKPTDEFESWLSTTYEFEGDEGLSAEGAVSGPLSQSLKGRLALRYDDRDGYVENSATGDNNQSVDDITGRATLLWEPSDDLAITAQYAAGDYDRVGRTQQLSLCTPAYLNFLTANGVTGEECTANYSRSAVAPRNGEGNFENQSTEFDSAGLTINWDLDTFTFTSLTGYAQYEYADEQDSDRTPVESVAVDLGENYEQVSQEFRVASAEGEKSIDYIAGVFYQHTEQTTDFDVHWNPVGTRVISTDQESDTYALFGQITWHINDSFDATLGGRYTSEDKSAGQSQFGAELYTRNVQVFSGGPGGIANTHEVNQNCSESNFSPTLNLQWRPNEDMMYYASIRRGFKGGGFDHMLSRNQDDAERDFQFDEEEVTAYELGAKLTLAEGRAELNATLFRSDYEDLQITALVPDDLSFSVGNAASAVTQGLELDGRWMPVENLTLSTMVAYLDAEFDEFDNAPCFTGQTAAQGCISGVQDLGNRELQFAPGWSATINAEYVTAFGADWELTTFLQIAYQDDAALALDLDPNLYQDEYVKVDARVTLGNSGSGWELSIIGRNLTDELTSNFGNDIPGRLGGYYRFVEPPRSLALQATLRY